MAKEKKSFILYADFMEVFNELSDVDAGQLIKHILRYVNDENPITDNNIVKVCFIPIKQQLKRDLKKWVGEKKQRSDAGKKGMLKRWGKNKAQKITKNNSVITPITNITDNVTVTVNVNDNDILSEIEIGATIQFCVFSLNRNYDKSRVVELWQAFLINGQEKNYVGRAKKIKHFRNWIKTQPHEINRGTNTGRAKSNGKSTGANNLLNILREDFNRPG